MPDGTTERMLPHAELRGLDGRVRDLRRAAGPQVVVFCDDDPALIEYVGRVAALRDELRGWGAELRAIVADSRHAERDVSATWLVDPDRRVLDGAYPVAVADEWGEIFHVLHASEVASLPSPEEIVDWTRFVAIQCPECEGPEGGWVDL